MAVVTKRPKKQTKTTQRFKKKTDKTFRGFFLFQRNRKKKVGRTTTESESTREKFLAKRKIVKINTEDQKESTRAAKKSVRRGHS